MRSGLLLVALAACGSPSPAHTPDALPDVSTDECSPNARVYTPVTVSGTTPYGPLDIFHYAFAAHLNGLCPDSYIISMVPVPTDPVCTDEWLLLTIYAPFDGPNPHAARANYASKHDAVTMQVHFDATQLDPPDAATPHINGHFISDDPSWTFDIAVDLISLVSEGCLGT